MFAEAAGVPPPLQNHDEVDNGAFNATFADFDELSNEKISGERLRSVIVIMRHGDRRPKEKLKFKSSNNVFLSYFKAAEQVTDELLIKSAEDMMELAAKVVSLLDELRTQVADEEKE